MPESILIEEPRNIVSSEHALTDGEATRRYRTEFRLGTAKAFAVMRPSTIVGQWKVLWACMVAIVIVHRRRTRALPAARRPV